MMLWRRRDVLDREANIRWLRETTRDLYNLRVAASAEAELLDDLQEPASGADHFMVVSG